MSLNYIEFHCLQHSVILYFYLCLLLVLNIHVTKGELFILCCVVVVTSVTALLSKQTLKELYSKYRASQCSDSKYCALDFGLKIIVETLKEVYSKYRASQSQHFWFQKNPHIWWQTRSQGGSLKEQQILGFRFWAQITNILFSYSIPEKVKTLNWN